MAKFQKGLKLSWKEAVVMVGLLAIFSIGVLGLTIGVHETSFTVLENDLGLNR